MIAWDESAPHDAGVVELYRAPLGLLVVDLYRGRVDGPWFVDVSGLRGVLAPTSWRVSEALTRAAAKAEALAIALPMLRRLASLCAAAVDDADAEATADPVAAVRVPR